MDDDNSERKPPNCWHFPRLNRWLPQRENMDQRMFSMRRSRSEGPNQSQPNQQDPPRRKREAPPEETPPVQRGLCCQMSECPNATPQKSEVLVETENLTIVNCPNLFPNESDFDFNPTQSSTRIENLDPPTPISPMPSRQQNQQQTQSDNQAQTRGQIRQQAIGQSQLQPQTSTVATSPPVSECQCEISTPETTTNNNNSNNNNYNYASSLQEEVLRALRNCRNQPLPQYRPMEQQPPTLDSTYYRNAEDDYDEEPCSCDLESTDDHQLLQFRTPEPKEDCNYYTPRDVSQYKNNTSMPRQRNNSPSQCPQQSMYSSSHGAQATSQYQMRTTEPSQRYQSQRTGTQTQGHMPQRPPCLHQNESGMQSELRQTIQTQTHYDYPELPLDNSMNRTQYPLDAHTSQPCKNAGQFSNMGTPNSTTYQNLPNRVSKQNVKFCEILAQSLSKEHLARMNEQTAKTNDNLSRQQYPQQQCPQQKYQSVQPPTPPSCCQSKKGMSPYQNQMQEPPLYQSPQQYSQQTTCQQKQQQQQVHQQHDLEFSYDTQGPSGMTSCNCHSISSSLGPNINQDSSLGPGQSQGPGPSHVPYHSSSPGPSQVPCPSSSPGPSHAPCPSSSPGPTHIPGPSSSPGPSKPCCGRNDARSMPAGHLDFTSIPQQKKFASGMESSTRNAYDTQFNSLVLDTYYPGVIEDTVHNKINFNEHAYQLMFGGTIPAKPKPDPITLLEAFHLRLDWERNDCSKTHSKSTCSAVDVENHFKGKNKTELNNAIASYMRAESVLGVSSRIAPPRLTANINRAETGFLGLPVKTTVYTGTTSSG